MELKSLIQWISASRAGKELIYHPFEQKRLHKELPPIIEILTNGQHPIQTDDLLCFLMELDPDVSVLSQLKHYAQNR